MYTLRKCTESCILNSNAAILHVQSLESVIHNDKPVTCYKDVSEHYRDCNIMGTVVHMSKVEGSWIWFYCYQVYVIQHLPIMMILCNSHADAHSW